MNIQYPSGTYTPYLKYDEDLDKANNHDTKVYVNKLISDVYMDTNNWIKAWSE